MSVFRLKTQGNTNLSKEQPLSTGVFLNKNFHKVDLQKLCRDLRQCKIRVNKDLFLEMFIRNTSPKFWGNTIDISALLSPVNQTSTPYALYTLLMSLHLTCHSHHPWKILNYNALTTYHRQQHQTHKTIAQKTKSRTHPMNLTKHNKQKMPGSLLQTTYNLPAHPLVFR